jgi:hypothetical protein
MVDYEALLSENEDGDQGPFVEALRGQVVDDYIEIAAEMAHAVAATAQGPLEPAAASDSPSSASASSDSSPQPLPSTRRVSPSFFGAAGDARSLRSPSSFLGSAASALQSAPSFSGADNVAGERTVSVADATRAIRSVDPEKPEPEVRLLVARGLGVTDHRALEVDQDRRVPVRDFVRRLIAGWIPRSTPRCAASANAATRELILVAQRAAGVAPTVKRSFVARPPSSASTQHSSSFIRVSSRKFAHAE